MDVDQRFTANVLKGIAAFAEEGTLRRADIRIQRDEHGRLRIQHDTRALNEASDEAIVIFDPKGELFERPRRQSHNQQSAVSINLEPIAKINRRNIVFILKKVADFAEAGTLRDAHIGIHPGSSIAGRVSIRYDVRALNEHGVESEIIFDLKSELKDAARWFRNVVSPGGAEGHEPTPPRSARLFLVPPPPP